MPVSFFRTCLLVVLLARPDTQLLRSHQLSRCWSERLAQRDLLLEAIALHDFGALALMHARCNCRRAGFSLRGWPRQAVIVNYHLRPKRPRRIQVRYRTLFIASTQLPKLFGFKRITRPRRFLGTPPVYFFSHLRGNKTNASLLCSVYLCAGGCYCYGKRFLKEQTRGSVRG